MSHGQERTIRQKNLYLISSISIGFCSRNAHEKIVLFMYYILKLLLNTQNDEKKNMYLDLDPENLCKIQGSTAEP